MKWAPYSIRADDPRALEVIEENLQVGDKMLARMLKARHKLGAGSIFALEAEGIDFDSLPTFRDEIPGPTFELGNRPIDGLIELLVAYLKCADRGAVLIQNAVWSRSQSAWWTDPARLKHCHVTRRAFYNQEMYHVLTGEDTVRELVEDTIREAWHFWFVGVCTSGVVPPEDGELSHELLSQLASNTEHIFVPAFHDGGFLIWTPSIGTA